MISSEPRDNDIGRQARIKPLVVVCGLAGSGISTALHFLEDAGYTAVDNLPLYLFDQLISREVETNKRQLVVSIDARTSGFTTDGFLGLITDIRKRLDQNIMLIFLTTSKSELVRRFNVTRRRHPLMRVNGEIDMNLAIDKDSDRMTNIAEIADLMIDTTGVSPQQLRRQLLHGIGSNAAEPMPIVVQSFSYRHGAPSDADMIFDMRFLSNPHWIGGLADQTGRDQAVQDYISKDPAFDRFMNQLKAQLDMMLPLYQQAGRPEFTIGFGCTGGRHRSVYAAEYIAAYLNSHDYDARLKHLQLLA
jgi:UPF0042 nucleotide-binding protein